MERMNSRGREQHLREEAGAPSHWGLYRAWSEKTYHGLGSHHRLGSYSGVVTGPPFASEMDASEWVLTHHPHARYMLPCRRRGAWRVVDGESEGNGLRLHLLNDPRSRGIANVGFSDSGEASIIGQVECFDFNAPDLCRHHRLSELSMAYGPHFVL